MSVPQALLLTKLLVSMMVQAHHVLRVLLLPLDALSVTVVDRLPDQNRSGFRQD